MPKVLAIDDSEWPLRFAALSAELYRLGEGTLDGVNLSVALALGGKVSVDVVNETLAKFQLVWIDGLSTVVEMRPDT